MNGNFSMNGDFRASEASTMNGGFRVNEATFNGDRLVTVSFRKRGMMHRSTTIARSLNEAVQRIKMHYQLMQLDVDSWNSRELPLTGKLMGAGAFIRSSRDVNHKHSLGLINSVR